MQLLREEEILREGVGSLPALPLDVVRYPTNYLRLGQASNGEKARVEAAR
jgi:hypothetical protein